MTEDSYERNIGSYLQKLENAVDGSRAVALYGSSHKAIELISQLKNRKPLSNVKYIIKTEPCAAGPMGLEVRDEVSSDVDTIVIVDFKYSIYASEVLFCSVSQMVINIFSLDSFYDPSKLVFDAAPPQGSEAAQREASGNINRDVVNVFVGGAKQASPILRSVEIETVNKCNGSCSFCPVSAKTDVREHIYMDDGLFEKIILELKSYGYSGRLALFSNNEPFIDPRIVERQKYARAQLPGCKMHLFTNGTLLTLDKFVDVIGSLDELIIDNYSDDGSVHPNIQKIIEYCGAHKELYAKVSVVMRNRTEILSTRGGDAPNRSRERYFTDGCALPFQQMVIRPDGKVSLCCNDPLGRYTLGDFSVQSFSEIWNGKPYSDIRKQLAKGRNTVEKCAYCDSFHFYT